MDSGQVVLQFVILEGVLDRLNDCYIISIQEGGAMHGGCDMSLMNVLKRVGPRIGGMNMAGRKLVSIGLTCSAKCMNLCALKLHFSVCLKFKAPASGTAKTGNMSDKNGRRRAVSMATCAQAATL